MKSSSPLLLNLFPGKVTKGDLRRIKIIESSIKSLGAYGIEGTTYESIAKFMGVRKSHVNYYYKSIDEIIDTVFQYFLSILSEKIITEIEGKTVNLSLIRSYIKVHFQWLSENPENKTLMLLLFYSGTQKLEFREIQQRVRQSGVQRIEYMLEEHCPKLGKQKRSKTAELLHSLLVGNLVFAATTENSLNKQVVEKWSGSTFAQFTQVINSV